VPELRRNVGPRRSAIVALWVLQHYSPERPEVMTAPIRPVMTPEEWSRAMLNAWDTGARLSKATVGSVRTAGPQRLVLEVESRDGPINDSIDGDGLPKLIALANAALPADDPRKITREWITALRDMEPQGVESFRGFDETAQRTEAMIQQMIAALESYLPPE
jgi:hypothetical protein